MVRIPSARKMKPRGRETVGAVVPSGPAEWALGGKRPYPKKTAGPP
jgi:hypothetical protein